MSLLEVKEVTKRFGGVVALDQVSFVVPRGHIVSIIGPNGAGKTTLFNCITGVIPIDAGTISFGEGKEADALQKLAAHEIAQFGIARTFQNIRLFASLSVLDNVLTGTHIRTRAGIVEALLPRRWGARQEEHWALDRAMRLLEQLRLDHAAHQRASSLPYGQQRRLELARALAADPELLLLDEPAAGLTFQEKQELVDFLRQLKAQGRTILLIEHDMRVVMPISDEVVVLDYGANIAAGSPRQIQEDPKVIEAYLGVQTLE